MDKTTAIGTITCAGKVHECMGLPRYAKPYSIIADANGDAWFSDYGTASVGRISPNGRIVEFTDPRLLNTYPSDVTITPQGRSGSFQSASNPCWGGLPREASLHIHFRRIFRLTVR